MKLPLSPPIAPMLAKSVTGVPEPSSVAGGLLYEPKWDGFRCIVFRDGDEVELGSRSERPLTRYFPEVVAAVLERAARALRRRRRDRHRARRPALDFEALLQRIHPADVSRATCWPPRPRRRSSRSTCSPSATTT